MARVTMVGTQLSRVIEDKKLPNSVLTGTTKAIFQDGVISEHILDELVNGIALKAERYFDHAKQGHYVHGIPTSTLRSGTQGREEVEKVLSAIEGQPIAAEYARVGGRNLMHRAWEILVSEYGYNTETNMFRSPNPSIPPRVEHPDWPSGMWLQDMQVVIPTSLSESYRTGVLDIWGRAANNPSQSALYEYPIYEQDVSFLRKPSPHIVDDAATAEAIKLKFCQLTWNAGQEGTRFLTTEDFEFTIPLSLPDAEGDFFHASYYVGNVRKFWTYRKGTGTYPALDALETVGEMISNQFFPLAYFRYDGVPEKENPTNYISSKNLVSKLGMNFDLLANGINENPDIDKVQQAVLMFGVPPVSTDPMELQYLYTFFNNVFNNQAAADRIVGSVYNPNYFDVDNVIDGRNRVSLNIGDNRMNINLSAAGMLKRTYGGVKGKIGSYSMEKGWETYGVPEENAETGEQYTRELGVSTHTYYFQVSERFYHQIKVFDLEMKYKVWGDYVTTSDEIEKIILIPLDHGVTRKYSLQKRETLYSRSLHLIFNSKEVRNVKWYQSEIFAGILMIIAIVLTAISLGSDGGTMIGGAAGAMGASSTAVAIINIVVNLGFRFIIGKAIELVAEKVGGFIAAIVAVAIAFYTGQIDISKITANSATFVMDALKVVTNIFNIVVDALKTEVDIEMSELQKEMDKATETLEKAKDLLSEDHRLSPFLFIGEKPSDFYNRTIHAGNTGVLSLSAISTYVDTAIKLPTFNDSIGNFA